MEKPWLIDERALAAAREVGRVVAVDVSPAMLAYLRDRAASDGLANLELVPAGFLTYRHVGAPADGVFERWLAGVVDDPTRGYTREEYAEHIQAVFSMASKYDHGESSMELSPCFP